MKKRNIKELTSMINSINEYNSNNGIDEHLTMDKAPHGHSYAYLIIKWIGTVGKPLLNWAWYGETHGFLKAYMKDMEFKADLESHVQTRAEELRCKEFNNLMTQIDMLKAELAAAKTYKQEDCSNDQVVEENKELKLKISKLEEDLNIARYSEVMSEYGEADAMLHSEKLLKKLEAERFKTKTLENEVVRLNIELSTKASSRRRVEAHLKKALSESTCPAGNLIVPSTQTITHNIRNSITKSAEYLQILFSAFHKGCLSPLSLNDASMFLEFSKNGIITTRIRSLILIKYITYIQLAHLM